MWRTKKLATGWRTDREELENTDRKPDRERKRQKKIVMG